MDKDQILQLINTNIANNSYTTAAEVREVLGVILDYIDQKAAEDTAVINSIQENLTDNNNELLDHQTSIDDLEQTSYLFEYLSEKSIEDTKKRVKFWYSFRGVLNGYVSYTFNMVPLTRPLRGSYGEAFDFDLSAKPELIAALNSVINNSVKKNLSFLAGIVNLTKPDLKRTAAITFELNGNILTHKIYPMDYMGSDTPIFAAGEEIFVSTELHKPFFDFDA